MKLNPEKGNKIANKFPVNKNIMNQIISRKKKKKYPYNGCQEEKKENTMEGKSMNSIFNNYFLFLKAYIIGLIANIFISIQNLLAQTEIDQGKQPDPPISAIPGRKEEEFFIQDDQVNKDNGFYL